jgi:hypothetical protein
MFRMHSTKILYLDQNAVIWLADRRLPKTSAKVSIESLITSLIEAVARRSCVIPFSPLHTLAEAGAEGIVSPVLYIPIQDTIPKPDFDLLCANCSRPYLFKNWSFWPEEEVRFVIKVNPTQTIENKGVLLEIMSKIIIDKIYLSPEMPSAENLNLQRFIYEKRFSRSFFQAGQEPRPRPPLAEADLPSGVFPDLD